jgi:hypothetical protein
MRSFGIAAASGAAAAGFVHLVAALADDDSTAAAPALQAGGLDHAKLADLVARQGSATPPVHGVTGTPWVHLTLGVARGLALATGTDEGPAHLLLALLYDPSDGAAPLWPHLTVDPVRVCEHLAETGTPFPPAPLPVPRLRSAVAEPDRIDVAPWAAPLVRPGRERVSTSLDQLAGEGLMGVRVW